MVDRDRNAVSFINSVFDSFSIGLVARDGLGIEVEFTLPSTTAQELERRGFAIIPATRPIGGAQAILIDWKNGTLIGGSELRKDGIALGL